METIEFRIMPNRTFKNINKIYIKMIKNILSFVDDIDIDGLYDLVHIKNEEMGEQGKFFQKVTKLTNKELYMLFHKFNQDNPVPDNVDELDVEELINYNTNVSESIIDNRIVDLIDVLSVDACNGNINTLLGEIRTPIGSQRYSHGRLNRNYPIESELYNEHSSYSLIPEGAIFWIPLDRILGVFGTDNIEGRVYVFEDIDGQVSRTGVHDTYLRRVALEHGNRELGNLLVSDVGWEFQNKLKELMDSQQTQRMGESPYRMVRVEPSGENRRTEQRVTLDSLIQNNEPTMDSMSDPQGLENSREVALDPHLFDEQIREIRERDRLEEFEAPIHEAPQPTLEDRNMMYQWGMYA
ncbi:MAG: hypothetical protein K8E24_012615, partial [Methanobacterium paludis]|nr:hypothetical protein [Methanobacterium paludis]